MEINRWVIYISRMKAIFEEGAIDVLLILLGVSSCDVERTV